MQANILVYDVGSTYTKAAAFNLEGESLTFLGRGQALTTLSNIMDGAKKAEDIIMAQGVGFSDDIRRFSSCSAAGGLRMVALGYMPRVTAKAAKEVSMTAGARVMEVLSVEDPPEYRREALVEIRPDIILLAGGTDSGDESSVEENVRIICDVGCKATVIIACNKYAQRAAAQKLKEAGISYVRVQNIMPTIHELNVKPTRDAIHEEFIKQITQAKGLVEFRDSLYDKTVVPTPGAVLLASELAAKGTYEEEGIGSLILIDIGGATTDIHSAIPALEKLNIEERGLVINNDKQFSYRTVEGNLGMRVSATGIPEAVGPKNVIRAMDTQYDDITPEDVLEYTENLEADTSYVPKDDKERCLDRALASCAIDVALRRHAGHFCEEEDPIMGILPGTAVGRDLRLVRNVICVGGIFVHEEPSRREGIVRKTFENPGLTLLPDEMPKIVIDDRYVLYAMGVLGKHYPDACVRYMKTEMFHVPLSEETNVFKETDDQKRKRFIKEAMERASMKTCPSEAGKGAHH